MRREGGGGRGINIIYLLTNKKKNKKKGGLVEFCRQDWKKKNLEKVQKRKRSVKNESELPTVTAAPSPATHSVASRGAMVATTRPPSAVLTFGHEGMRVYWRKKVSE